MKKSIVPLAKRIYSVNPGQSRKFLSNLRSIFRNSKYISKIGSLTLPYCILADIVFDQANILARK